MGQLVTSYETFGGNFCHYVQVTHLYYEEGAVECSGMLVSPYKTTCFHIRDGQYTYFHCHEHLKSCELHTNIYYEFSMQTCSKLPGHETGYEFFSVL